MKIIVDTSVWIEYLKNRTTITEKLDQLLLAGHICTLGPVVAELLQGARTEKDYQLLINSISGLSYVETAVEDWIKAGTISFKLKKKGITIPITDCLIAVVAMRLNASIMSYDQHFEAIPNLKLIKIPG